MDKAVPLGSNMVVQIHDVSKSITIYEGESAEDGAYFPAKSIFISSQGLVKLRDVLVELIPLDPSKQSVKEQ